jgi:hypothetical protein
MSNDSTFHSDDDIVAFSFLDDDPEAENNRFRDLVKQCDINRDWDVYIRQSSTSALGKRDSYVNDQAQIPTALIDCGIPEAIINIHTKDIDSSGALPIAFRPSLSSVQGAILDVMTGTIVCSDIARLFRDATMKGPTKFASVCELRNVKILTAIDDRWELLEMVEAQARNTFLNQCAIAASERLQIKSRLSKARLRMLKDNPLAWSGGPIAVGYAVTQRRRLATGKNTRSELYIYEPHAAIVLQVIKASLRPNIVSWPQLRDYCSDHNIVVPPFEEHIRLDVAPKSVLWEHGMADMDEARKLGVSNLKTILGNELLLGDRLYGSGQTAKYVQRALKRIEEAEGQKMHSSARQHRLPLDLEPVESLKIIRTPDQEAMFWAAAKKWLPYNLRAIRQAHYAIHPDQWPLNKEQTAGKSSAGKRAGGLQRHPWSGKVFCAKHGLRDDGWPVYSHPMQFRNAEVICYKDHRKGGYNEFCSTWGGKRGLSDVLTNHLIGRIGQWLLSDTAFIADVANEQQEAQVLAKSLRESLAFVRKKRDASLRTNTDLGARLEGMESQFIERQVSEHFSTSVKPLMVEVQNLEQKVTDAERAVLEAISITADENYLRSELQSIVDERNVPSDKLRELIELFVENVNIMTSDFCTETLVIIRWRDRRTIQQKSDDRLQWLTGAHDILLCWRNWNKDNRPWTDEEENSLTVLWPASSGASYETIKASLLPGRKWSSIYRKIMEMKLTDGSRSRKWQIAAQKSEQTLATRNSALAYMVLQVGDGWPDLLDWATAYEDEEQNLWGIACDHAGNLMQDHIDGCSSFPLAGGWQLPVVTKKCIKMVLSCYGCGPTGPPSPNTPCIRRRSAPHSDRSGRDAYIAES